jgi:FlaA1/EpsC-like NDP-sugar epimerase
MFKKNLPRGIIFLADMGIVIFSLVISYLIRFNFSIPTDEIDTFHYVFPVVIVSRALLFYFFKTYAGIIRYTSTKDVQRILITIFTGSAFFALLNPVTFYFAEVYAVPYSIIIIEFLLTIFMMTSIRLLIKILYVEIMNPTKEKTNVIIFGAGESGVITKRTLDRDAGTRYKVLAFADDNENKAGKKKSKALPSTMRLKILNGCFQKIRYST